MPLSGDLRSGTGAAHAALLGVGAYRPERIVPNTEVVDAIDSSDEWIQQRSGIRARRFAGGRRRPGVRFALAFHLAQPTLRGSSLGRSRAGCASCRPGRRRTRGTGLSVAGAADVKEDN